MSCCGVQTISGAPAGGGAGPAGLGVIACDAVALFDVAIATDLEAGDTVDGVVLVAGNIVLLAWQIDPTENGAYEVQAAGAAVRIADLSVSADFLAGLRFCVTSGNLGAGSRWVLRNSLPTLGVTPIVIDEEHSGSPLDYLQHDDWIGTTNEATGPLFGAHGWVSVDTGTTAAANVTLRDSTRGPVHGRMVNGPDQSFVITPFRAGEGYSYPDADLIEHHQILVRLAQLGVDNSDLRVVVGFADTGGFPTNGASFQIVWEASANWFVEAIAGGVNTSLDSGIAVVEDQWIQLDLWMTLDRALFVIDRQFAGEIITNVPAGTGEIGRPSIAFFKGGAGDVDEEEAYWSYYSVARRYTLATRSGV